MLYDTLFIIMVIGLFAMAIITIWSMIQSVRRDRAERKRVARLIRQYWD